MIWKIILAIYIISLIWSIYEFQTAPLYPEDYDDEMSDVNKKKEH